MDSTITQTVKRVNLKGTEVWRGAARASACVVTLVAAAKGNDDGAVRKALALIRKAISRKGRF